jgi:hypothetical protein
LVDCCLLSNFHFMLLIVAYLLVCTCLGCP